MKIKVGDRLLCKKSCPNFKKGDYHKILLIVSGFYDNGLYSVAFRDKDGMITYFNYLENEDKSSDILSAYKNQRLWDYFYSKQEERKIKLKKLS